MRVSQLEMLKKTPVIEIKIVEDIQYDIDEGAKIFHGRSIAVTTNEESV